MPSGTPAEPASPTTQEKLVAAAMAEFNDHGYSGTDTNRIARRAGFAPQTFYRWFKDKTEVFIAAYRAWEDEEIKALGALFAGDARAEALTDTAIAHHRRHLVFRRSLRQLSFENPDIRAARAAARMRQIQQIRAWVDAPAVTDEQLAVILFQFERLADAVSEAEFADMGLSDAAGRAHIAGLIDALRG